MIRKITTMQQLIITIQKTLSSPLNSSKSFVPTYIMSRRGLWSQSKYKGITGIGIHCCTCPVLRNLLVTGWSWEPGTYHKHPFSSVASSGGASTPQEQNFLTIVQVFGERKQGRKPRRCAIQKSDSDNFKWRYAIASASKNCVFWSTGDICETFEYRSPGNTWCR